MGYISKKVAAYGQFVLVFSSSFIRHSGCQWLNLSVCRFNSLYLCLFTPHCFFVSCKSLSKVAISSFEQNEDRIKDATLSSMLLIPYANLFLLLNAHEVVTPSYIENLIYEMGHYFLYFLYHTLYIQYAYISILLVIMLYDIHVIMH